MVGGFTTMWTLISNETSTGETEPLTGVIGSTHRATAATAVPAPVPGRHSRNGSRIKAAFAPRERPVPQPGKRAGGEVHLRSRAVRDAPRPQLEWPGRAPRPAVLERGLRLEMLE